ncbi:TetR/AcrR family transcriptional regulator [Chloroflexota bacterium]
MTPKESETRAQLIAATLQLWRETHDISKVSLADISREAGTSPTTVYNIFGNRAGLITEVIKYLSEEMLNAQWTIMRSDLPIPQKMQSLITAKFSRLSGMQRDVVDKLYSDATTKQYLDDIYEAQVKPMMTEIIENGKREGYINPDIPDEAIMLYLDIIKAGGTACAEKMQILTGDSRMLAGFTRLFYHGLFQKDFNLNVDFSTGKETA